MMKMTEHVKCTEDGRNRYGVCCGNLKVHVHWEDLGLIGNTVLKWEPREREWESVDWIDLARDKDKWLTVVKTVVSPRIA
jgi:hypothetical protein